MLSAILRLMMSMGSVAGLLVAVMFFCGPVVFLIYILFP